MINWASPQHQYLAHAEEIDVAIATVLHGDRYILGPQVEAFEREFADYIGCKYAVGVSSGLAALALALRAMRIGPSDEVITVAMTAPATIQAIHRSGATPVVVDIDPETRTINPIAASMAVTKRTKAVMPVHLYGHPCAMTLLAAIGLPIIEDCAQATGATCHGARVGSIGHIGCFSFYPTKNLGAIGDGGMVVTDDPEIAIRVRNMRLSHRLDEMQAAILRVKLKYLDAENERRREIARHYGTKVRDGHVYHLYVIESHYRDRLRKYLADSGINVGIHYATPATRCELPHTNRLCQRALSLPMYPELTDNEVDRVLECIQSWSRVVPDSLVQPSAITGRPSIQTTASSSLMH